MFTCLWVTKFIPARQSGIKMSAFVGTKLFVLNIFSFWLSDKLHVHRISGEKYFSSTWEGFLSYAQLSHSPLARLVRFNPFYTYQCCKRRGHVTMSAVESNAVSCVHYKFEIVKAFTKAVSYFINLVYFTLANGFILDGKLQRLHDTESSLAMIPRKEIVFSNVSTERNRP
jgi:hypothetical protein